MYFLMDLGERVENSIVGHEDTHTYKSWNHRKKAKKKGN